MNTTVMIALASALAAALIAALLVWLLERRRQSQLSLQFQQQKLLTPIQ